MGSEASCVAQKKEYNHLSHTTHTVYLSHTAVSIIQLFLSLTHTARTNAELDRRLRIGASASASASAAAYIAFSAAAKAGDAHAELTRRLDRSGPRWGLSRLDREDGDSPR